MRDRISYGAEAPAQVKMFFEDVPPFTDPEVVSILKTDSSPVILKAFIEALEALPDFTEEAVTACFKAVMKSTGLRTGAHCAHGRHQGAGHV